MIKLLFFIIVLSLFGADHNNNNITGQNQLNLTMLGYCTEVARNPQYLPDNLQAIRTAWNDNFDNDAFERNFPETSLQKDSRLEQAYTLLKSKYNVKYYNIYLKKIIENGNASIWIIYAHYFHKTYLVNSTRMKRLDNFEIDVTYDTLAEDDNYIYGVNCKKNIDKAICRIDKKDYETQQEFPLPHSFVSSLTSCRNILYSADDDNIYELSPTLVVTKKYFIAERSYPKIQNSLSLNNFLVTTYKGCFTLDSSKDKVHQFFSENARCAVDDSLQHIAVYADNLLHLYKITYNDKPIFELIKNHQIGNVVNFIFIPEQEGLLYILLENKWRSLELALFDALNADSLLRMPIDSNFAAQFYCWDKKIYINGNENKLLSINWATFGYKFIKQAFVNHSDSIKHTKLPILPIKKDYSGLSIWSM